ncbi:hypothetical protein L1987_30425 [Smallanthus sonchifolius]|uniref:Uncharacterized protein n=1 Tax=Smallanthus sonchifolius TaxID=185202 RepID=A0ACB9I4J5_9ASTR|nr:hypothetical protein L1987_30425 [Smallanthus sonchifolius]
MIRLASKILVWVSGVESMKPAKRKMPSAQLNSKFERVESDSLGFFEREADGIQILKAPVRASEVRLQDAKLHILYI